MQAVLSQERFRKAASFNESQLEKDISKFGKEIFSLLSADRPSAFGKSFWAHQIMNWSMSNPAVKANIFRLVDVLPALRSDAALQDHLIEYLDPVKSKLPWWMAVAVLLARLPLLRPIVAAFTKQAVKEMAGIFIAGADADQALSKLRALRARKMAFTVDLLGEFTTSENEADKYLARYLDSLDVFSGAFEGQEKIIPNHPAEASPVCISVKLTALYSQCSNLNFEKSVEVLSFRLSEIVRRAKKIPAQVYVDAEDSANNEIIYQTFKNVFGSEEFKAVRYPGIVVQAYSKDSKNIIEDLLQFAKKRAVPIAIRLVKGAYWDYETIISAQLGLPSPLLSQKESSDAQYEELSRRLLEMHHYVLPAFGSHNIRSLTHACCYAEAIGLGPKDFELQMLYGMAEPIARAFAAKGMLVRLYTPLGEMLVGMGYLVRRLLENTSNESFLRATFADGKDALELLKKPVFKG